MGESGFPKNDSLLDKDNTDRFFMGNVLEEKPVCYFFKGK